MLAKEAGYVNPWETIDLHIYEEHMRDEKVLQLQTLNDIMRSQINKHYKRIGILGIAGGNGLEHIDKNCIDTVFGIDVNKEYLEKCRKRYLELGDKLQLLCIDLSEDKVKLPQADLLICNIIIEYLGITQFANIVRQNRSQLEKISCIIQRNSGECFVSVTQNKEQLDTLESVHHDIDEKALTKSLMDLGFICTQKKLYPLPTSKKFIQLDFSKG